MTLLIGTRVDATTYEAATERIMAWAAVRESRYVCVANAHVIMEAHDSDSFKAIVNNADLVTPDGMPLVWMLRARGFRLRDRVYGPTLMKQVVARAAREGVPIGLYGSMPQVLESLRTRLKAEMPGLEIAYACSPSFRDATPEEDQQICREFHASGARILFVGLGCPKQERWMASHRGKINAPMVGVGAAFDFLSGAKPQAPLLVQRLGLEWAYRLVHEPRRLWRRYLIQNPRFAVLALAEFLRMRSS